MLKCTFIKYRNLFNSCTATPKHIITITKYSNSNYNKYKGSLFNYSNKATAVKSLNKKLI